MKPKLTALVLVGALAIAAPAFAERPYTAPRDAFGHPRLEGVWAGRWLTNLERPAGTPLLLDRAAAALRARELLDERAKAEIFDGETAEPDAPTLALVGGVYRGSLIVDPPDGRLPLTDAGRAYLAALPRPNADGPESRLPPERCLVGGQAGMLITPAAMLKQIIQTRDAVVIHSEAFGDLRILPTDPKAPPPKPGQSTARWEGETLVVETAGFSADDKLRGVPYSRFPLRPQTRMTERFTRTSPRELLYEFRVEDPVLYAKPWRAEYAYTLTDEPIYEFACHEGNYGLANILSGAREEERRAREASRVPATF